MIQKQYWKNGQLKEKRIFYTDVFDYYMKSYHSNGQLYLEFQENDGDNLYLNAWDSLGNQIINNGEGYFKSYYENGQLESEGFVNHSRKDSNWIFYYSNGVIRENGKYRLEFLQSEKTGKWTTFYSNGTIESEKLYDENRSKIEWTYYHNNGIKKSIVKGADFMNRQKNLQGWDINGNLTCKDGEGYIYNYYENGILKSKIKIHRFLKDTATYYYPTGQPAKEILYFNDDSRPSIWISESYLKAWNNNGDQTIINGTGWLNEYDEDSIKTRTDYKNGKMDGKRIIFYKSGRKKQVDTFRNNKWKYRVIYFDNGNKYYEFDSNDVPLSQSFTREWWYNGNLKKEELKNKTVQYHPNGQLKSYGYYPTDTSSNKYEMDYYLAPETFKSYGSEFTYNPFQNKKSWFSDGTIKFEVNFDSTINALVGVQYLKNGKVKSKGEIKYGTYSFDPDSTMYKTEEFIGYLKVGVWQFHTNNGTALKAVNMEDEGLKRRLINAEYY